jgi:hypothetical protein
MWKDPDKIMFTVPLYSGGCIEFGRGVYGGGMTVGTSPIMARLIIPKGMGEYPEGWFIVEKDRSIVKIQAEFKEKDNFIPEWLLLDCYRYHYHKLKNSI